MDNSNLENNDIKDIEIRIARENDIEDILNIEYDAFDKDIWESREIFLERINEFKEGFLVVAYKGKTVGYISSEIWSYKKEVKGEDFVIGHSIIDSHNKNGDELYISAFGMLSEVRGKGFGEHVFDYFLKYVNESFENVKSIVLVVSEEWKAAVKIYESKGFERISYIDNFFEYKTRDKKEVGIIMRRKLKN